MTPPPYHSPSHLLFPPNTYPSTTVGDAVSNLVSFNIKSLQYLLRSLPSLASLAALSLVYVAKGTALFLVHTSMHALHKIGRAETSLCSNCGSESQNTFHVMLDCPVLDSIHLAIFDHSLTILDHLSRPWGVAQLLGLCRVDLCPHPKKWVE